MLTSLILAIITGTPKTNYHVNYVLDSLLNQATYYTLALAQLNFKNSHGDGEDTIILHEF